MIKKIIDFFFPAAGEEHEQELWDAFNKGFNRGYVVGWEDHRDNNPPMLPNLKRQSFDAGKDLDRTLGSFGGK